MEKPPFATSDPIEMSLTLTAVDATFSGRSQVWKFPGPSLVCLDISHMFYLIILFESVTRDGDL